MLQILQTNNDEMTGQARELFREYESWLGMSLCFQNFEQEVAELPGKYSPPSGRLFLAYVDGKLAGCIAMRALDENGVCEMKRLFVRNGFRGARVGIQLIERLIDEARLEGYKRMRLDTFPPKMGKAVSLYESHGFRPIPSYYNNPHEGVLFMELEL